jgi:hypothetical protein
MDKYPVYTMEVYKENTSFSTVDEIINYFEKLINEHEIASYITTFDVYKHTDNLDNGTISEKIKSAKNIIYCFGKQIPSAQILALRPRSINVTEEENLFSINFLEVPNEEFQKLTEKWVSDMLNL